MGTDHAQGGRRPRGDGALRLSGGVTIRKARAEDAAGICAVAEAVRLDLARPQPQGFLVYVLDPKSYAERLAATKLFYVAIEGGAVVGFIAAYTDRAAERLVDEGLLSRDLLRASAAAGCDGGRWVYGDQIAVHPAYARCGIAPALVWALWDEVKGSAFDAAFVCILHDPLNRASKAFCERLGFAFQGTLRYADGRLWGLYRRDVPTERTA